MGKKKGHCLSQSPAKKRVQSVSLLFLVWFGVAIGAFFGGVLVRGSLRQDVVCVRARFLTGTGRGQICGFFFFFF